MNAQPAKQTRSLGWWIDRLALLMLIFICGTWAAGTAARANLLRRFPAPGQMVDVGGYKMHLYCTGQGSPTVILVAGIDDFSTIWSLVQPELAQTTRVCSYDRAGLGWSDPSPFPRTMKNMVKELRTLLMNADVENPYVLVGHSFGGALVRLYAHDYPEGVAGMVLIDSVHEDWFLRMPIWEKGIAQKIGMFQTLAPLSSMGLLALAPESIPNRGLPEKALSQYRAISAATPYYETGITENEAFEMNLAEVRAAHVVSFGDMPLVVLSRGYWESLPFLSDAENQRGWQTWQEMQARFLDLSSESKQVIAQRSEHFIQLQQPELVVSAIKEVIGAH